MLTSGGLLGCGQPPYFKAQEERVHLVNNSAAYDRTWQELWGFLAADTTDKEAYTPEHMCGFFAEELHNRAEYYGFKTAFVVVEFETDEPHALNAFNTVDYGLVYIDCTGKGRFEAPAPADKFTELALVGDWDKVAYIEVGKPLGLISLGYNQQKFSYEWYEKCKARLKAFEVKLDAYNTEVEDYNTEKVSVAERKEWAYIAEGNRLAETGGNLRAEWSEVRGYNWQESDSPVTSVKIYW